MEGGWEHTLSSCLNLVIKGMRINRHKKLVRMVRDAILHSNKGDTEVYAHLRATRHKYPLQVTDEVYDFRNDDSASEHNTGPPILIDPFGNDNYAK